MLEALSCFPMYMVANVDAWTADTQFRVPILDPPGSEILRESFALGAQEGRLDIEKDDDRVLKSLGSNAKPLDLVTYEYALETLQMVLGALTPGLAERVRTAVAQMGVAVARVSGERIGGTGAKVSDYERACIAQIREALSLGESSSAASTLAEVF